MKPRRHRGRLQRQLVEARALLGRARVRLGGYPNVVAVGVGLRERGRRHWPEVCFIVEVGKKEERTASELIPLECESFPVDVQQRSAFQPCSYPASQIQRVGHHERGRTGLLVRRDPDQRFALTAMHVLGPDQIGFTSGVDTPMDVKLGVDPRSATGQLVYGVFDQSRDMACIELPAGEALSSNVGETGYHFDEPSGLGASDVGKSVGMVIGKGDVFQGQLVAYPIIDTEATFVTDLNQFVRFHHIAKFAFRMANGDPLPIQQGWSGSVIYRWDTFSPIALLSFRNDGLFGAYGFPLMPTIQAGGFSIWKG